MRKSPPRAYPREQESPNREEAFGSGSKDNDSSGQYQSKLLSTKATAKEVEKEKLTLLNRIALLEREEQKVLKKIEDAKGRALDILSKKSRNNKVHDDKERERLQRERELEAKRNQIDNLKVQMAEKVREAKTEKELASKEKADEIRENMRKLKEKYKEQHVQEHAQHLTQVQDIKHITHLVQLKKKERQEEVQTKAKQRYEEQVKFHEESRVKMEDEISRLEQREKELLSKLKQTQVQQQKYSEDLERIMNNQEPINIPIPTNDKQRPSTARK